MPNWTDGEDGVPNRMTADDLETVSADMSALTRCRHKEDSHRCRKE